MPGIEFAVGTCVGLGCFLKICVPVHSRCWNLHGPPCGSRWGKWRSLWVLVFQSKIFPVCKKEPLTLNHMQMQRKVKVSKKENKLLTFYLGGVLIRVSGRLQQCKGQNLTFQSQSLLHLPAFFSATVWVLFSLFFFHSDSQGTMKANEISFVLRTYIKLVYFQVIPIQFYFKTCLKRNLDFISGPKYGYLRYCLWKRWGVSQGWA